MVATASYGTIVGFRFLCLGEGIWVEGLKGGVAWFRANY